jgi:glycosyltransferase involved in cell wall biosynthesis
MTDKKNKLVMTLLVRDEEDIVEKNICFHLNHGVDYIIASDNGSTDRTVDILKKYAKKKLLSYNDIQEQTYEQSKWVSEMAKIAVTKHKATHLFHCDADEFWFPESGNLKSQLPNKNEVFYVPLINYLPEKNNFYPHLLNTLMVAKPYELFATRQNSESYRYLLYKYQPKIMTTSTFTKITQGNHNVTSKKDFKKVNIGHIIIHHFPVRSYAQFERKVINGGTSYARNPNPDPDLGWHWKDWYNLYNKSLLKDVYLQICIEESERKILKEREMLKEIKMPLSIFLAKKIYLLKHRKFRSQTVPYFSKFFT